MEADPTPSTRTRHGPDCWVLSGGTVVPVHTYGGARANQAKRTSDVEFGARDALKER